jgi:hypothetical protein
MKKFIITEEEKSRILSMHQQHGYNSLNEQSVIGAPNQGTITNSSSSDWTEQLIKLKPNASKKTTFSKLPAVQVSQPNSEMFYTQNRWFQFPKGVTTGEPTLKGSWKLENGKVVALSDQECLEEPGLCTVR